MMTEIDKKEAEAINSVKNFCARARARGGSSHSITFLLFTSLDPSECGICANAANTKLIEVLRDKASYVKMIVGTADGHFVESSRIVAPVTIREVNDWLRIIKSYSLITDDLRP